jgi:hypothetical protein
LPKYSGYAGYGLETVIGPIEIKPLGLKLKRATLGLVLVFVLNSSYINKIPIFVIMKKKWNSLYYLQFLIKRNPE